MITFIKPIVEYYKTTGMMDQKRKSATATICRYLRKDTRHRHYSAEFYQAIEALLNSAYYQRVLLYLPFDILIDAPESFKKTYMRIWHHMLKTYDARENFHEGDVFEVDARPSGKIERIVKCAHLTPWLLQAGFLRVAELCDILHNAKDDELLLRSFADTWDYIADKNILSNKAIKTLKNITGKIPAAEKLQPTYISEKRLEWLKECKEGFSGQLLTPKAHLEGPFSPNLSSMDIPEPKKGEVIFVGGSRLKGYGVDGSDLDTYSFSKLYNDPMLRPGSPHSAHIYFNSMIVGRDMGKDVLKSIASTIMSFYSPNGVRKARSIERLEIDLLQYRLLHKGFQRFTGKTLFSTSKYTKMDGDCPFYDDEYRKIATMLYAKYVYMP